RIDIRVEPLAGPASPSAFHRSAQKYASDFSSFSPKDSAVDAPLPIAADELPPHAKGAAIGRHQNKLFARTNEQGWLAPIGVEIAAVVPIEDRAAGMVPIAHFDPAFAKEERLNIHAGNSPSQAPASLPSIVRRAARSMHSPSQQWRMPQPPQSGHGTQPPCISSSPMRSIGAILPAPWQRSHRIAGLQDDIEQHPERPGGAPFGIAHEGPRQRIRRRAVLQGD